MEKLKTKPTFEANNITSIEQFNDISEQQSSITDFVEGPLEVELTDDGYIRDSEVNYHFTVPAMESLCRILKIPSPFAKRIPMDLLQKNIHRLSERYEEEVKFYYRKEEDHLVITHFAKESWVPVNTVTLLDKLTLPESDEIDLKNASISDLQSEVNWTFKNDEFQPIEPVKGDIIETGIRLLNSQVGYTTTKAQILMYRLVCSNRMIAPEKMGVAKMRLKPNRDIEKSINTFSQKLIELIDDSSLLEKGWLNLNNSKSIPGPNFQKYWKALYKMVEDPEFADEDIFKTDEDTRKDIFSSVRSFKKGKIDIPLTLDVAPFEVVNNITDKAKQFDQLTRQKMEYYAGKILEDYATGK